MSRLVARLLLSMFMFPLATLLYVVSVEVAEPYVRHHGLGTPNGFTVADVVTWAGVAAYWCLLWRTGVRWTAGRRVETLAAVLIAGLVGAGGAVAVRLVLDGDAELASFVGGVLAMTLWLVMTVFAWRETAAERAARVGGSAVACPTCGYNLTGLAEARCPECGSRFTLDELLAAQPSRVAAADLA